MKHGCVWYPRLSYASLHSLFSTMSFVIISLRMRFAVHVGPHGRNTVL